MKVINEYRSADNGGVDAEGRAAAAYLRQLKIDFATHGAASMRLRERIYSAFRCSDAGDKVGSQDHWPSESINVAGPFRYTVD